MAWAKTILLVQFNIAYHDANALPERFTIHAVRTVHCAVHNVLLHAADSSVQFKKVLKDHTRSFEFHTWPMKSQFEGTYDVPSICERTYIKKTLILDALKMHLKLGHNNQILATIDILSYYCNKIVLKLLIRNPSRSSLMAVIIGKQVDNFCLFFQTSKSCPKKREI